ncbi:sensor histidine kinase [Sinomicrobium weinanense]|uniref:histidine kinase n=1 Tax=Sinomicrobium weinanense TaxID=2842200 RepID=A0A926JSF3_9FLAO|nr:ATP-binding protein [Sinomicrobium weinanense]MBC9796633.1 histidine kinase [Sinomicrobium weinanense]MBU3123843.1 histidine kinase [Sinomicrobium weinanense]
MKERNLQYQQEIKHQKDILKQQVEVQESERERIAVLLHDDVGNRLNILSVWLNNPDTWDSERTKKIISSQIPELIDTTRNISHSLYPVNLERFGLILTIEELIANIELSLSVRLILRHEYTQKDIVFELQLYRIIQEFTSNVIKHSKTTEMLIHLRDSADLLCVILSDNGIGFKIDSSERGMGLRNIALRIKALNASYKWKSRKNNGCRLIIVIPKPS